MLFEAGQVGGVEVLEAEEDVVVATLLAAETEEVLVARVELLALLVGLKTEVVTPVVLAPLATLRVVRLTEEVEATGTTEDVEMADDTAACA